MASTEYSKRQCQLAVTGSRIYKAIHKIFCICILHVNNKNRYIYIQSIRTEGFGYSMVTHVASLVKAPLHCEMPPKDKRLLRNSEWWGAVTWLFAKIKMKVN